MFITADQLLAHAVGDYIFQSHWMATEKIRRSFAAAVHVLTYGLAFVFFHPSVAAWAVILGTHFVIDRWRLARYVIWVKNAFLRPAYGSITRRVGPVAVTYRGRWHWTSLWAQRDPNTGFPKETPPWLAFWLLIIVDNVMHVLINGAALKWL